MLPIGWAGSRGWLRDTELSAWVRHTGQVDHKEEMQLDSDDPFLQSVSQASCRRSALSPDFASTNDPSLNVLEHLEIDACLTVHQVEAFDYTRGDDIQEHPS